MQDMTTNQLLMALAGARASLASFREKVEEISAEIARRYKTDCEALYRASGKEHGTVTIETDRAKIKGLISKKVEWDEAKLRLLANELTQKEAEKLFTVNVAVPERAFSAATGNLRARLEGARTVTYGDLKVSIDLKDGPFRETL